MFYAFNLEASALIQREPAATPQKAFAEIGGQGAIQDVGKSKISYDLEPISTNQILLRVWNRADRFDDKREIALDKYLQREGISFSQQPEEENNVFEVKYLNIDQLANALYFSSTNSTKLPNVRITETEISGTHPLSSILKQQLSWKCNAEKDTAVYPKFLNPEDKNGTAGVALQPQAIRTFVIRYQDQAKDAA